ncbi:MAG TPA: hypothetical protein VHD56_18065 [Tepidisphaeraceae bacterium]|nr:hypothetical protein [Tepidisphaeraceae bacterium]
MSNRKPLTVTSFLALSDEEKEAIYQECETINPLNPGRPLTPAQRKLWQRTKRKLGRPVKGQGHKVIAVSLEKGLLKRADTYVKKTGMTRAALIARGLEAVLPSQKRSTAA